MKRDKVSILVLLDAAHRPNVAKARKALTNMGKVSILVLLDAAHRQKGVKGVPMLPESFNPCSPGCRTSAMSDRSAASSFPTVSILVLLDAAHRPVGRDVFVPGYRAVSILVLLDAAHRLFERVSEEGG